MTNYHETIDLSPSFKLVYTAKRTKTRKLFSVSGWKVSQLVEGQWREGATCTYDPCNTAWWMIKELLEANTTPKGQELLAKWK